MVNDEDLEGNMIADDVNLTAKKFTKIEIHDNYTDKNIKRHGIK